MARPRWDWSEKQKKKIWSTIARESAALGLTIQSYESYVQSKIIGQTKIPCYNWVLEACVTAV
jgi:predicted oxidoreductase (fatty acid repression mutant protein)